MYCELLIILWRTLYYAYFLGNFIIGLFFTEIVFKVFVLLFMKMSKFSLFRRSFSYFAYSGLSLDASCLSQPF